MKAELEELNKDRNIPSLESEENQAAELGKHLDDIQRKHKEMLPKSKSKSNLEDKNIEKFYSEIGKQV